MSLPYTHLHLHTEYSLLDGANKIKSLAKKVKQLGMNAVSMTDHGNMFGAIDFYTAMKKEGIKPVIGIEAYLHNADELNDKGTKQRFHLCLYAKNEIGYKNLMYLSSMSFVEGFYYYPRINKKLLRENSEGLICSSACLQGEVQWHLNINNERNVKFGAKGYEYAKKVALEYRDIFGEDFYLEIMRHGINDQLFIDEQLIRLSLETGIKIIATNDTHYQLQEDAEAHDAFMCIAMNKNFEDTNRMRHSVQEFYLKSPEQMSELFADIPEALLNTQEIVDKCNLELKLGNPTPPSFKFTAEYARAEGLDMHEDSDYFTYKCREGLQKRLKLVPSERHKEYTERLEREIEIINKMKFPGYMLIVWDFVRAAKDRGIPVGPGRGSAAGSLVAFCLEITDIDPMKYALLFERFLNPERVSMPDIDMDFCQSRRGEILDYVINKYGRYNVAQVITFGTLQAKGVIRDVARVMGMPYGEADAMAKLIPDELGITLNGKGKEGTPEFVAGAFQKEPKIKELIDANPKARKVWEFALLLEGLKRNAGTHAAAVVIDSERELWHKAPLYKPSGDDTIATQYSMKYLEDVDLIKFDFLGLKTLTVIRGAMDMVNARYGREIDFNALDVNDAAVYETIQSGHTIGLFQVESKGMQDLNKRLKPTTFEDIIAVLALYRPGPMESGMLDDFIDRKHGRAPILYMFPELEPILKPTYGVIVYQEQVMQIVQAIGGFSLGGADLVRRAMGKKIKEEMDRLKGEFANGAEKKGFERAKSEELFDLIVKFAGYGFNKSHSAAYAMVTFQTTYLKTYYPHEFMAALLTSEQDNTDKIVKYVDEAKRMGIKILPPSIERSSLEFSVDEIDGEKVILFGLGAIRGAGEVALNKILEERKESQFANLEDFIGRIDAQKVNKRVLESLIKSGSLSGFGYSRRALLEQIEAIIEASKESERAKKMAENSLFGDSEEMVGAHIEIENLDEYTLKKLLELEKETLGFYVSGHPLDDFRAEMADIDYALSSSLEQIEDGSSAIFVGKIEDITIKFSKKGNRFGIVNLLDFHGNIEMMLFERMLDELEKLDKERPIAFKCTINKDGENTRLRAEKILTIEEAKGVKVDTKISIQDVSHAILAVIDSDANPEIISILRSAAIKNQGRRELKVVLKSKLQDVVLLTGFSVSSTIKEACKEIEWIDEVQ
ncbi:MAG: DNA polymerase III subunit alpha [Wolinella sp.]